LVANRREEKGKEDRKSKMTIESGGWGKSDKQVPIMRPETTACTRKGRKKRKKFKMVRYRRNREEEGS